MTSAEKLAALCEKAQAGGFNLASIGLVDYLDGFASPVEWVWITFPNQRTDLIEGIIRTRRAPAILFDHGFWKALVGEEMVCDWCGLMGPGDLRGLSHSVECAAIAFDPPADQLTIAARLYHVGECARLPTLDERIDYCYRVSGLEDK